SVGCACAMAAVNRGSAREIVNGRRKTAEAVATDLRYGTPLMPKVDSIDGDYDALGGARVALINSGINEKTGGATDRSDPARPAASPRQHNARKRVNVSRRVL